MIQRIQSVFLLVSLCFMLPMFFVPVAKLHIKTDVFSDDSFVILEEAVTFPDILFDSIEELHLETDDFSGDSIAVFNEVDTFSDKTYIFNLAGFYTTDVEETTYQNQYSIMLFGILICAINLIIILLYKRRLLQLRFCIYNILFLVGLFGIIFFIVYNIPNVQSVSFHLPIVFPVISVILHYLAFRNIRKDEMMVQSLNRLR